MTPNATRIVAWHPVLTDHQAYTYQALAQLSGLRVVVHVSQLEDDVRRAQGWTDSRVDGIERQLLPARGFLRQALRVLIEDRKQVHLFGSAFAQWRMLLLLWLGTRLGVRCYLISEPYAPVALGYFGDQDAWQERWKLRLRPIVYRLGMLALRRRLQGVFAISRLASSQFAAAGMPLQRLFPFGYFVPSDREPDGPTAAPATGVAPGLRIAFVGSLIARKGLPTLLAAVRRVHAAGVELRLDVYGPGDPGPFAVDDACTHFPGRIPFGSTQTRLRDYDLLVLPSLYDGWGVVVNEALCAGVPVLCSDGVGARVLVETFGAGAVFPRGDVHALADALLALAADPARLQSMKAACPAAAEAIQPQRAAAYMLEVLTATPAARAGIPTPWYRTGDR